MGGATPVSEWRGREEAAGSRVLQLSVSYSSMHVLAVTLTLECNKLG